MDKPKAKSPPRRKRPQRRPKNDPVYYVVAVEDWDWGFWFGVSNMPQRNGPYDDYRHLNLRGKLLRPAKLKCEEVELHILPNKRLDEGVREQNRPVSIGHINLRKARMDGILSMPADALPLLLTLATAEKLRFMVMQGERLRYGSAAIKSFRLEMNIGEDDLPDEE